MEQLRRDERWAEARHVVEDAASRPADANASELEARLNHAAADLRIAQELEETRQTYSEPNPEGYNYNPAKFAYGRLFVEIGAGPEVPSVIAAATVRASAIREQLLVGLDNAAFVARVLGNQAELERLLAIARLADPDPSLRDRFRDPALWRDREALLKLVDDARAAALPRTGETHMASAMRNQRRRA